MMKSGKQTSMVSFDRSHGDAVMNYCNMAPTGLWYSSMAWVSEGFGVIGGFVFERYTGVGGSVHVHLGGKKGWLTPKRVALGIAQLVNMGVKYVFAEVRSDRPDIHKLVMRLGMEPVACLQGYYQDADLVVYRGSMDKILATRDAPEKCTATEH